VSSDVDIYSTGFTDTTVESPDANNLWEQRTIRFNSHPSNFEFTVVTSVSSPRVATAGGAARKFEKYCLIQGPGGAPEVVEQNPWTRFEYDSLYTLCVQMELDINHNIVSLAWRCFDPDTQICSAGLEADDGDPFVPVTGNEDVPYEFLSGDGFNVLTPKTKGFNKKYILGGVIGGVEYEGLCPAAEQVSFMDFLDFLGPTEAHAACTCPPGVKYTSRKKSYCICY
jgi:hypothetical protein